MVTIPFNDLEKIFLLKIYLDFGNDEEMEKEREELKKKYIDSIIDRQTLVHKWIQNGYGKNKDKTGKYVCVDSGFDLYCFKEEVPVGLSNKINLKIKCSMSHDNMLCGYYMYPRSSMGSKTPLRLSNSVGIIDAGYRGNLMGIVDNLGNKEINLPEEYWRGILLNEKDENYKKSGSYKIKNGERLFQICPLGIYPIYPILVDGANELGETVRGIGGLGSTGR